MLTGLRLDASILLSPDPGLRLSHDVSHRLRADLGRRLNLSLGYSYSSVAGHGLSSDLSGAELWSHQICTKASVPSASASHSDKHGRCGIQGRPIVSGMIMWVLGKVTGVGWHPQWVSFKPLCEMY